MLSTVVVYSFGQLPSCRVAIYLISVWKSLKDSRWYLPSVCCITHNVLIDSSMCFHSGKERNNRCQCCRGLHVVVNSEQMFVYLNQCSV